MSEGTLGGILCQVSMLWDSTISSIKRITFLHNSLIGRNSMTISAKTTGYLTK